MPTTVLRRLPSRLQRQAAAFGPAIVVLVLGCIIFVNVKKARDSRTDSTRGTYALILAGRLQTYLLDAEANKGNFLITGKASYLPPYKRAIDSATVTFNALRVLLERSTVHASAFHLLDTLVPKKLQEFARVNRLARAGGRLAVPFVAETDQGNQQLQQIRSAITTIRNTEQRVVDTREQREDIWERQALIVAGIGTVAAVVFALIGNMFLTRYADTQTKAAGESAKRSRRATEVAIAQTTARQAAEAAAQEYRRIFSQAPVAISVLRGPTHIVEIANQPFYKLMGRGEEILGKPVREAFPELADQDFFNKLDHVYQTGLPHIGKEARALRPTTWDAQWARGCFNYVYQPLVDDANHVYGIATVAHDVTELVEARNDLETANTALQDAATKLEEQTTELEQQMEESLAFQEERDRALLIAQEAQRTAEAANMAKTQFLATMSHELRTPLNAVNGYAELMLLGIPGDVTPQQTDFLNRIARSGRYLLALINDILNYARLEAGRVEFHIERISVDATLRSIEPMVALQVAANGLTYNYTMEDPTLMVYADPERLRQIVLNLVSNAIKFTAPGGSITLSSKPNGDEACIHVTDTGCGISHDKLTSIFDPFVQVDRQLTTTGSQQGVGLGLAISRDLARQMNGDLSVVSEVGHGSQFTLTLPRAASEERASTDADYIPSASNPAS